MWNILLNTETTTQNQSPYLNKQPTNTKKTLDWVKGAKEGLCPRDRCWCEFTLKTLLHTQAYHGSLRFIRNFWPKQGHQQFITSLTKVAFRKTGKIVCHWIFQIFIQLYVLKLFQKPRACELPLFLQGRLCHCITGQTSKSSILKTRNYDNDPESECSICSVPSIIYKNMVCCIPSIKFEPRTTVPTNICNYFGKNNLHAIKDERERLHHINRACYCHPLIAFSNLSNCHP